LFVDPVAVATGYWVCFVEGTIYYVIPLLNFVGCFVLMFLTPLALIHIGRRLRAKARLQILLALAQRLPLFAASILLALLLNGLVGLLGVG
jgi:uncharacterized membrane protein